MVELRSRARSRQASTLAIIRDTFGVGSAGVVALKNSMGSATCPVDGHASSTIPSMSGAPSVSGRTTSLRT